MEHDDPVIVYLTIDGEEIVTTPEHPFYTEEDGWVPAGELSKGMRIRKADGEYGVLEKTRTEKTTKRMYNLTVGTAHTFFVGDGQWLVHNNCGGQIGGTQGLNHSFDRHSAEWFGRPVSRETHLSVWQALIERASQSDQMFPWSTGSSRTIAHLARIDGKWFVTQFFVDGSRAGELATAFIPKPDQLAAMLALLGH